MVTVYLYPDTGGKPLTWTTSHDNTLGEMLRDLNDTSSSDHPCVTVTTQQHSQ